MSAREANRNQQKLFPFVKWRKNMNVYLYTLKCSVFSTPDFSGLKLWKSTSLKGLPGCFMQLENRSVYAADQEILTQVAKSVGKIHVAGTFYGTVFRVGPNYIMTAKHVIDGILDCGKKQLAF